MGKINLENGLNQFGKWTKSTWKIGKGNLRMNQLNMENGQNELVKLE